VQVTVFRRDQLRTVEVTLALRAADEYEIKAASDATAAEGAAFERWLGAPLASLSEKEDD
jgi:predicted metalloprotease with PDZ domain